MDKPNQDKRTQFQDSLEAKIAKLVECKTEAVGSPLLTSFVENLPSDEATTEKIRSKRARDRCLVTL